MTREREDVGSRLRDAVEGGALLPETAAGMLSGGEGRRTGEYEAHHDFFGSSYWWESLVEGAFNDREAQRRYPDHPLGRFRFKLGWYRAGCGVQRQDVWPRSEEALEGWDEFARCYPHLTRADD